MIYGDSLRMVATYLSLSSLRRFQAGKVYFAPGFDDKEVLMRPSKFTAGLSGADLSFLDGNMYAPDGYSILVVADFTSSANLKRFVFAELVRRGVS